MHDAFLPRDLFLEDLKEQQRALYEAAELLGIPSDSPYRERERELGMRIREHREMMRS
jgi:hypothetical protein